MDFETSHYEAVCASLRSCNGLQEMSREFGRLRTDKARMRYVLDLPAIQTSLDAIPAFTSRKSSERAVKLRQEGNRLFQDHRDEAALLKYSESIATAPNGDDTLAMAFANRSAVSFRLAEHNTCLRDISQALLGGYPKALQYKLHERRARCLMKRVRYSEAAVSVNTAIGCLGDARMEDSKRSAYELNLQKLMTECKTSTKKEPLQSTNEVDHTFPVVTGCHEMPALSAGINAAFPSLADSCRVTSAEGRGRFIEGTRDIMPGEVILTERPYASVLLPAHRWNHCHHCMRIDVALLPCVSCDSALFCSEKCRDESHIYHQVECRCLAFIHESGVGKFGHLALRTIAMSPLHTRLKSHEDADCKVDTPYTWDDFGNIISLVTHADDRTCSDLFRRAVTTALLTACLHKAGYFNEQDTYSPPTESIIQVSGMLLSLLQLLPCNAHEVSELQLDPSNVATSVTMEIGAAIYSTLSLFNHSCDPAVVRHFHGDACIVRAIKTIRHGDEVADNYGAVFPLQSRSERRDKLASQYHFMCECVACQQDWPLYQQLPSAPTLKCAQCKRPIDSDAIKTSCRNCGMTTADSIRRLAEESAIYRTSFNELLACQSPHETLERHLAALDELVCLPWKDYCNSQETLKQCYCMAGNCHVIK